MKTNVMTRAAQRRHLVEQAQITKQKRLSKPIQASDRKLRSMPNISSLPKTTATAATNTSSVAISKRSVRHQQTVITSSQVQSKSKSIKKMTMKKNSGKTSSTCTAVIKSHQKAKVAESSLPLLAQQPQTKNLIACHSAAAKAFTQRQPKFVGCAIAPLDTSDLQSQDSTSFELQSSRCAAESHTQLATPKSSMNPTVQMTALTRQASTTSLSIPTAPQQITSQKQNLSASMQKEEQTVFNDQKVANVDELIQSKDVSPATRYEQVELKSDENLKKLPSEQQIINTETKVDNEIKNKLPSVQLTESSSAQSYTTVNVAAREEVKEQAMASFVPIITGKVFDAHYCNIEENIDEMERRIKQEKARYCKLIANRHIYEQWMGADASRGLVRDAAFRLMNFDPNFDAEPEPLPRPWLQHRQQQAYMGYYWPSGAYSRQAPASGVFAYPQLPRGRSIM